MDIHLYNCKSSAFQAAMVGTSLSAGRIPAVMKVIAFQAKISRRIESFHCEGIFGLKSRIFITAEFILRGESSSETCLEGRTFIRHEDAKSDFRFSPVWIFVCATAVVLPFRQGFSCCLRPQVAYLRLWRLLPFRQKWVGELKASTAMDISVFESISAWKAEFS